MSKETPSMLDQLKRAVEIAEQIEVLQRELDFLLKGSANMPKNVSLFVNNGSGEGRPRKKRNLSPEARERIAAAQRLRWGRYKKAVGE